MSTIIPGKIVPLDKIDQKILRELVENCRRPVSQIARKVNLSRASVEYRLHQLEEKGLITGYRAVVNISLLGYKKYHLFLSFQHPQQEREFLRQAEKSDFVNSIITYRGNFTVEIAITAKTDDQFQNEFHLLLANIKIDRESVLIVLETLKSSILPSQQPILKRKKVEEYPLDKKDIKLLQLLAENAKMTTIELAHNSGLSRDSVSYRIKRLINSSHILQFRPALNYLSLGLEIHTLLLKVNHHNDLWRKLESFLKNSPETIWIAKTIGSFDYIVYLLTKDHNQFHSFFDTVKERFGEAVNSYHLLTTHRQEKYLFMTKNMDI